jgi:hypothetical protein
MMKSHSTGQKSVRIIRARLMSNFSPSSVQDLRIPPFLSKVLKELFLAKQTIRDRRILAAYSDHDSRANQNQDMSHPAPTSQCFEQLALGVWSIRGRKRRQNPILCEDGDLDYWLSLKPNPMTLTTIEMMHLVMKS